MTLGTEADLPRRNVVLVTGVDESGRSSVIRRAEFEPPKDARASETVFEVAVNPPPVRPPAASQTELLELGVPLGTLQWRLIQWKPDWEHPKMHHTDTMDFHTVITGTIEIILDDGPHQLGPGDGVVVAGINHAWKVGPAGCTTTSYILGTPARLSPL
jgi:mannose-6-phosphate isomerase-like protein (cupin superfamily)